jgi:Mce-associated membrane protein
VRRASGVATRVIALLALLGVVAVGLLLWDASQRRGAEHAGAQALQAARESIPDLFSYQPGTVDKVLPAAAQDRLTGKFLADYTQLLTTVVIPEAKRDAISASATVPAAGVVTADTGQAIVLAYVDQSITVGKEGRPTQTNSSVRVTLNNVDGRWLISGFDPI